MKDYSVKVVRASDTKEWLLKKHYAHRIPSISFAFGLYERNVLVGICTYGVPASPSLVQGVFGGKHKEIIYELNRLVTNDDLPRNALSFFVAQTFKLLPRPLAIVSYSDTSMHHHGYIYQALNFVYTGLSSAHKEYRIEGVNNKHSRHLFDDFGGINKMKEHGIKMDIGERARKHRNFNFLGSKRQKKQMLKRLQYPIRPYPKGENERYDASYKPTVQLSLF
jgi:hypothetical protein